MYASRVCGRLAAVGIGAELACQVESRVGVIGQAGGGQARQCWGYPHLSGLIPTRERLLARGAGYAEPAGEHGESPGISDLSWMGVQ